MSFKVGDQVRHKDTQQQGRIVRIPDLPLVKGKAYVVKTALGKPWGEAETEVLWQESEIKKTADSAQP